MSKSIRLTSSPTLHSHEATMIVNNVIALAKTAKVFNVPTTHGAHA